jgi:hypothetical protein
MQRRIAVRWLARLVALSAALGLGLVAPAALGAGKPPPPPKAKKLELKKVKGLTNGQLAYLKGRTAKEPSRYFASGVLVTQPVLVTLKADRPGDDVRLAVTKTQWSKAEREVSTGASGRVQVAFRTQGEFGLAVSGADAGKPYRMTVWIGDEVRRPMAPVVVPRSKFKPAPGQQEAR